MSLKRALEALGKGPCYHMQEIWGKPDMKETLTKWADIGELTDIEAGKVRFKHYYSCTSTKNRLPLDINLCANLFQSSPRNHRKCWF